MTKRYWKILLQNEVKSVSRQARKISATGFYHIGFRGINRLHLFEEDSDFLYFLENLQHLKSEMLFELHAYCLMIIKKALYLN